MKISEIIIFMVFIQIKCVVLFLLCLFNSACLVVFRFTIILKSIILIGKTFLSEPIKCLSRVLNTKTVTYLVIPLSFELLR